MILISVHLLHSPPAGSHGGGDGHWRVGGGQRTRRPLNEARPRQAERKQCLNQGV